MFINSCFLLLVALMTPFIQREHKERRSQARHLQSALCVNSDGVRSGLQSAPLFLVMLQPSETSEDVDQRVKKKSLRERKEKTCGWMLEQEIPDTGVHVLSMKAWLKKTQNLMFHPKYSAFHSSLHQAQVQVQRQRG